MNNKTEAYKFLREKGINPVEPIYWDSPSKRIDLDELLQEFATQQNKAQQSNIEILRADNKANIEKIEALESELSQQKELVQSKEIECEDYEDRIVKLHLKHIKDIQEYTASLTTLKQEIEGLKKVRDMQDDIISKHSERSRKLESQSLRIKELEEGVSDYYAFMCEHPKNFDPKHILSIKSLLSTPTTEEEKVLYTKSATVNSGDSINEEIFISKEEGKIGSPIQPRNPLDNAYEK